MFKLFPSMHVVMCLSLVHYLIEPLLRVPDSMCYNLCYYCDMSNHFTVFCSLLDLQEFMHLYPASTFSLLPFTKWIKKEHCGINFSTGYWHSMVSYF